MLKSLDILIGVSLIMLIVSMTVTVVTQAWTSLFNKRGKYLLVGISDLLRLIDPQLKQVTSQDIARNVLTHELVRGVSARLGNVVRREELTNLLLELAGTNAAPVQDGITATPSGVVLRNSLKRLGIQNPQETLAEVHRVALELEKSQPELASNVRQNAAVLKAASSDFVARLNMYFDDMMDRVTERFTFSTRMVTFVASLAIAVVTQLDVIAVVNKFSLDDKMRDAFVQEAIKVTRPSESTQSAATVTTDDAKAREYYLFLGKAGVLNFPTDLDVWFGNWANISPAGILLSALLLSLGAPFWYSQLNNLIRLRSVIAHKDDAERKDRQSNTQKMTSAVSERGDLTAVG